MYVPPGFAVVTPYFFVYRAEEFVHFLQRAFGGVEVLRTLRPDRKIANAQVRIDGCMIMVSEASTAYPAMPASYYLYVEDAQRVVTAALAAGAKLEMDVADMPYGDRQGGVRDPHGNIWWVSQRLMHSPYSA